MEFIQRLVNEKYKVFNVNAQKEPVDKFGHTLKWKEASFEQLCTKHDYNSRLWGMKLGEQFNGKHIMSLDFDLYDKKTKQTDKNTEKRLQDYMKLQHNKQSHGMYDSSTEGNVNILIDYTNNDNIKKAVTDCNKYKFKLDELEILLLGYQVIPPSQTNSKRTLELGPPRTFKNNKQPFYILGSTNDPMETYIVQLFEEKFKKNTPTPTGNSAQCTHEPVTTSHVNNTPPPQATNDKYIDLLFNVIHTTPDWNKWFQIAGILKHNGYDYAVFKNYSDILFPNDPNTKKLWDSIKHTGAMSIYGLQNIAKEANPIAYKKWLINHNHQITVNILKKGENDVALYISNYLKDELVYANAEWFQYNFATHLWCAVEEPSARITSKIQRKIDEAKDCTAMMKEKVEVGSDKYEFYIKEEKELCTHHAKVCKASFNSQVKKYLKTYLENNKFFDLLDNCMYKMAFQNGIFDIETMNFRQGISQSDYISKTLDFAYCEPTETEKKWVLHELKKICNWNDEHLEYYLSVLGYAMTGDSKKEQNFWYYRGEKAANGKSVIFEALETIMEGVYVMKANSDFMDVGADLRKEIATWRGLRLLWVNEVSDKKKNAELVKSIGDGTSYGYNPLYAKIKINMPITFKLLCIGNGSLHIKGDQGIVRRFKLGQFDSEFRDDVIKDDYNRKYFVKDKEFNTKLCTEYKNAFVYILLSYANRYYNKQELCPYPKDWEREAEDCMADNNQVKEWFDNTFTLHETSIVCKDCVEEVFKQTFKDKHCRDELKALKLPIKYNSQRKVIRNKKKYKGFWEGMMIEGLDAFGRQLCDSVEEEKSDEIL